ncbi:MAG: C4-type zinc ribbon domain-containing protein [Spirosomataceae bacterium]
METTIAQKLDALLKLQQIDSSLDEIKKMRGDLPEEVQDLEDEIAGFDTRIGKFQRDIDALEDEITKYKNTKKDAEKLIGKYKDQQMNVRNNREYDAISKEIELQQLEIELADKRINESNFKIRNKQEEIDATKANRDERKKDLDNKKKELDVLMADSREEENDLKNDRDKAATLVDDRFFKAYERIRSNSRNGLAVVMVKRGACGGCFNMVPPQRQADIREKKKIIVCEHCGRILADVEDMPVAVSSRR